MRAVQATKAAQDSLTEFKPLPGAPRMRRYPSSICVTVVATVLCIAQIAPASAGCVVLAGTADGFDKDTAVGRAQLALEAYVQQYKSENHLDVITVSAMRAEPRPYWRGKVTQNMMRGPDIVTEESYTVCWQGVVSSYVCTSGARVCW